MCERTQEFLKFVNKADGGTGATDAHYKSKALLEPPKTKTAFNEAAGEIARGVHKTSAMLTKLTNLVRRQGLFDDPTEEINTLIFRIKQDLDELNSKCDSAQQYVESKKSMFGDVDQSAAHNVKVVSHLKTDLMHTTKDFKTVLEMRSSKMKDQQVRKVELIGKSNLSPMRSYDNKNTGKQSQQATGYNSKLSAADSSNSDTASGEMASDGTLVKRGGPGTSMHHRKGQNAGFAAASPYAALPYGDNSHLKGQGEFATPGNMNMDMASEQQQLLLDPVAESQYFDQREKAVTEVEKTIGELGNLFNRLATMIAEQQELVERVDEDIEEAVANSNKAQDVLMKAYEKVSGNRAMYMKLFAIFGVFAIFFVLFLM